MTSYGGFSLARALAGAPEQCWWGWRLLDAYPAAGTALWPPSGGIYIFAEYVSPSLAEALAGQPPRHRALYVGETADFSDRLVPSHEYWSIAETFGMTHIHVLALPGATKRERLAVERELCEQFQPTLNWTLGRRPSLSDPAGLARQGSSLPPWTR